MKYFAVINENKLVGFIVEEEQQAFLVSQMPSCTFHEFMWIDETRPPYPSDFEVVDGTLIKK